MRKLCVLLAIVLLGLVQVSAAAQARQERDPFLYGLASLVVPGLGQVLQGETTRGLTHFGVAVAIPIVGGYLAMVTPYPASTIVWSVVGAASLGVAVYSAIDSYELAVAYNRRHGFSLSLALRM